MMSTSDSPIIVDDGRSGVVRVSMRGVATRNRLDPEMVEAVASVLDEAESRSGVAVFVLTSAVPDFCTGMALGDAHREQWREAIAAMRTLLWRLSESSLITVAVVDGPAVGGGVGLAAACDHVIAGPGASFRMTEVLLGLIPAAILPCVARRVGQHRAFSLALTAREISGRDTHTIGLADEWTTDTDAALRRLLILLRSAGPGALQALKRYRARLFGAPGADGELLREVLGERMSDPRVGQRLRMLQSQGLLP